MHYRSCFKAYSINELNTVLRVKSNYIRSKNKTEFITMLHKLSLPVYFINTLYFKSVYSYHQMKYNLIC